VCAEGAAGALKDLLGKTSEACGAKAGASVLPRICRLYLRHQPLDRIAQPFRRAAAVRFVVVRELPVRFSW
jgi:hypothetical protein